jgi:hypothetical protein
MAFDTQASIVIRKSPRYVIHMSAAVSDLSELEHLRSIYRTLHRLQTNIQNTQAPLRKGDLTHAEKHLAIAQSDASEAKHEIALVGTLKAGGG